MAKIKYTKNELKAQRDALRRFRRYLPTLQLKKQQLQIEMRRIEQEIEEVDLQTARLRESLAPWIRLFAWPVDLAPLVRLREVRTTVSNIAGVNIPVLEDVSFEPIAIDLHATDSWIDDARAAIEALVRFEIEREILAEQHRLLGEELRITTQRVNLFEKVKIPEAQQNIRVIRIFLGDQQTAEVARAKIAKGKTAAGGAR